jgi:mannose-6-phosphate isomerase-like protein (cupin superfamily)
MKNFVKIIEDITVKNEEFRKVLYAAKHCQIVVMALKPTEETGMEVHKLDQIIRIEEGTGEAVLDGVRTVLSAGCAKHVPAGANHNIINTGRVPLKLTTLYTPPNPWDGGAHHARTNAKKDNQNLHGEKTEYRATASDDTHQGGLTYQGNPS